MVLDFLIKKITVKGTPVAQRIGNRFPHKIVTAKGKRVERKKVLQDFLIQTVTTEGTRVEQTSVTRFLIKIVTARGTRTRQTRGTRFPNQKGYHQRSSS